MSFASASHRGVSASPNITPLVDVLLVLLIIFMVLTPSASRGLSSSLPVPASELTAATDAEPILVEVLAGDAGRGTTRIRLQHRPLPLQDLTAELRSLYRTHPHATLWFRGDAALSYGVVVSAMANARSAGFHDVALLPGH